MSGSLLYLSGVTKSFDGFAAINGLSLVIMPGELRAVIGPNGAGKTTMMDIITGKTHPDRGQVFWKEKVDLSRIDEVAAARLGIGRKFQKPTVIDSLTVAENLELALKGQRGLTARLFGRSSRTMHADIMQIADRIGLAASRNDLAGTLSHGQKQWLEIGMLLAQDPDLMLVDEPAAGMTDEETMRTAELLRSIAGHRAVIVVEHDMDFVRALGCKVTVLHQGRVLAEGPLDFVSANPEVIEVYLGR
ncbi:urea transport system ATP-binding protein [Albidovulum inexpectatum]|uniref:Urea transport system ATP-binding protein n=1 Tax=Albidovulum inexpectatum TaxID=196587 RepID=A0A2S5JHB9_9RHOB|nr:urea ABC transporter ATP-binding protein UrtD [Albidovulum inexpectatum]PPB80809.1 urea transport system ATP-binding protein [Albidovulum inexpectatum]